MAILFVRRLDAEAMQQTPKLQLSQNKNERSACLPRKRQTWVVSSLNKKLTAHPYSVRGPSTLSTPSAKRLTTPHLQHPDNPLSQPAISLKTSPASPA